MSKGDAADTINRLLQVAEELFAAKGFDGTSINMLAEKAGVNKALIYYYFKDKDDIVNSLCENIIKASDEYINDNIQNKEISIREKLKEKINFMQEKQKILGIMLMESLKGDDKYNYLFQWAEKVIANELNGIYQINDSNHSEENQLFLVHEFFTGVIPIIAFILFKDKWCEYYQYDSNKLTEHFLESFKRTHLDTEISKS